MELSGTPGRAGKGERLPAAAAGERPPAAGFLRSRSAAGGRSPPSPRATATRRSRTRPLRSARARTGHDANDLKNSNPRSPMTSRTARTTPSSQKHLASSAVPSAAQHRSRVPCASVLHAPAMPAKTNTRQSTAPAPEWSWRGSKCAACAAAGVDSRGGPSRAVRRGGEGDRGGEERDDHRARRAHGRRCDGDVARGAVTSAARVSSEVQKTKRHRHRKPKETKRSVW